MRRKWSSPNIAMSRSVLLCTFILIGAIGLSDGARRVSRRRVDSRPVDSRQVHSRPVDQAPAALPPPVPSAETLLALGEAMGAAAVEHYTEGKPRVQRLIRPDQGDDLIEHQGVIGKAGVDFPAFPSIPPTGFNCKNVPTGYYADLETDCQVFHICDTSRKISFLCPNGTIFSQSHLICDWWFKVDCASAPALYESSAEYYSNEQKKTHKVSQPLTKTDFQKIEDTNRAESKRTSVNVPSTTERLLKHRQRLQNINLEAKPTSRSYQALFADNFHTTQRAQTTQASTDKRRKNLVQLIANNFGNSPKPTAPAYTDATTYRANAGDYNGLKEMQVAAETASFAQNNNRQYLQDFHNKNYRPYPVYTPNLPSRVVKTKTLTTLYDFRDRQTPVTTTTRQPPVVHELPKQRPTLIPYTKSYTISEKREPYTRPGVSLLKDFLEKEKNRTFAATTERATTQAKERSDQFESKVRESKVTIDTKDSFESATKIPLTTRAKPNYYTASSSDRFDVYSSTSGLSQSTPIPTYQERRERLLRKLNTNPPTEPTVPTLATEKFYGDLPNRPGLVVPPSLTPKTLHSLAIYYATALDNLGTTQAPDGEVTTAHYDEYEAMEEALPALFSQQTINKYSNLFAQGVDHSELLEEIKLDPNGTYNELAEDLSVQQSQNPFATSPQIRELAQVFTHALSAYLQDPVQFRKVLSDIRPTLPSFGEILTTTEGYYNTEPTTTINEDDDEILGFSDDNKVRPALASLRDAKALNIATDYPAYSEEITTPRPFSTETIPTTYRSTTTPRNPFRCCGRISASYTSASTPVTPATIPISTNTVAVNVNTLSNNDSETYTTTENSYTVSRVGGFQNNTTFNVSPYGDRDSTEGKPLTEYIADTNLPSEWGIDGADPTVLPHSSVDSQFESKKIKATTFTPATTPVYFTETDSIELENEEELQRAQSHSFVTPQSNNVRQSKQINFEETKPAIRKPSEELEAPTLPDVDTTTVQTTTQPSTTVRVTETEAYTTGSPVPSSIFTAPDSEKSTNEFTWPSTYESWQSTIVDPITINDDLTQTALDETISQLTDQTNTYIPTATTPAQEFTATSEQAFSSSVNIELTTPSTKVEERFANLIKDSSTESQDLTTIADTVVEKAKEMMNATTTEKLMNVMKKTKSKTVRRLILLLVQTCDDDHNTTAEASKKALLEALMAVSQKDMEEIAKEEAVSSSAAPEEATTVPDDEVIGFRRTDKVLERQEVKPKTERRGKSYSFDPSAINSLSNPQTNAPTTTTTEAPTTTSIRPTLAPHRRGTKKFLVKTPVEVKVNPIIDAPIAEARVAAQSPEVKAASDTRALELLRSLYTIAARWG